VTGTQSERSRARKEKREMSGYRDAQAERPPMSVASKDCSRGRISVATYASYLVEGESEASSWTG